MRDFVMPKCPEKWTYEERMFYRGIQEALETLGAKVSENDLSDKLKKKLFSSQDDINANIDYSTSEVATGGRWVDGKPIYRSVIVTGAKTANTQNFDVSALNVETFVDIRAMLFTGAAYDGEALPVPFATPSNAITYQAALQSASRSALAILTTNRTWKSGFIIIEYTKTTDQPAT